MHVDADARARATELLRAVDGVEEVLDRDAAAAELSLPADRIGDLVVLADAETVLGKRENDHDLSALRGSLRSHGGRHEQSVPIFLSHPQADVKAEPPTNADIHALLLGEAA